MFDQIFYFGVVLLCTTSSKDGFYPITLIIMDLWLTDTYITVGTLTYEEAERRRAGWECCEKLQHAEALVSHVQVVVCGSLFTAELLQSPPLHTVPCMLHQCSEQSLTQGQKADLKPLEAALHLRTTFTFSDFSIHKFKKKRHLIHFYHCSRTNFNATLNKGHTKCSLR